MRPGKAGTEEGTGGSTERAITLEVTHIRPWGLATVAVGISLLGTAAIINSVDDWIDSRQAEDRIDRLNAIVDQNEVETDCRAALAAEVGNLESERTGHLAAGLVAVVREDEQALNVQIEAITALEARLQAAREERANAVELCDQPDPE